jgi:acyl-coenzyme A synthetase/AMP-(fatty) acid ligase
MNISDIIKRHVSENPEKTDIIFDERHVSYTELDTLINKAAKGSLEMGLKRGDVLSLFLPSIPERHIRDALKGRHCDHGGALLS